ncbi:prolyl oligopeptidase-like protein [Coleophoma cylindrospora]|uniref:Prolyl oligopeptidase-like protein n=1 Tax=Coleophoma cylindrospora TaxID=1849047 RepID=A0A3D8SSY1_9HELO|nr:prolyl oligopeptidase-like protein [Coleophoma cylindrospora]
MPPPRLLASALPRSVQLLSRRTYASSARVPLAFDLYEAPSGASDPKNGSIIFMHGLFGSRKNNRAISKILSRDLNRTIYAIDLRNHGDSPHDPRHDYSAMADDVAGFIEEHKLKDTTLIGHSMGAKTAMTLALKSPEMVRDFVSVDNAPIDAQIGRKFGQYVQAMKKIEDADTTKQSEADKILQDYEESLPVRQFLLTNLYRPTGEKIQKFRIPVKTLGAALDHMGDFPFKDPGQVRFEKPALFVRGTKSQYIPDEALPIIGKFFPRFELADIDAGHWVISEQPEAFRNAVVEFLKPKE